VDDSSNASSSSSSSSSSRSGNAVPSTQVASGGGTGKRPAGRMARKKHAPQHQGPAGVHSTQPAQEQPSSDVLCEALDFQYLDVSVLTTFSRALCLHTEWRGTYPRGNTGWYLTQLLPVIYMVYCSVYSLKIT
jgi:hypothetical protein